MDQPADTEAQSVERRRNTPRAWVRILRAYIYIVFILYIYIKETLYIYIHGVPWVSIQIVFSIVFF